MSDGSIVCRRCGAVNDPGANYCYQCGANLAEQRAADVRPEPSDQVPSVPPAPAVSPEAESRAPESPASTSQEPAAAAADAAPSAPEIPPEPQPSEPPSADATEAEPSWAVPPPPAEDVIGTGTPPPWPFEVPAHQEEAAGQTGQAPPPPPAAWIGQAGGPPPLSENVTSSARYIVLAGIGLLVLSCLWVFLSIGTHLQARFGIFCLAPLGLIFLVVGLFLMLQRGQNRRP